MKDQSVKHIYWFAYYNLDSPSVRYRAKYPLEYARKHLGISHDLIMPGYRPRQILFFLRNYFKALFFLQQGEWIIIQRLSSGFLYSTLLRILVRLRPSRTMYDLDDADYLKYPPRHLHFFAKHCRYVLAGSKKIKAYLSTYNQRIVFLTSPVYDLGKYKEQKGSVFTIGWTGGFRWGHQASLEKLVFPAIKTLPFPCRLLLVGVQRPQDQKYIRSYFADAPMVTVDIVQRIDWNDEPKL
ncbi:MAG: hypothetical protein AAGH79_16250, partial [Bacteroidota bacterium]